MEIDVILKSRFPDLKPLMLYINDVKVQKRDGDLETFKVEVIKQIRKDYDLDSVKDHPTFRAYRDFFWGIGIDPTKNRPAAEALTRRILSGKKIPSINTLVDVYNIASVKTGIALATFDTDKLEGNILLRFAEKGEQILVIGTEKPVMLKGGEIVVSDKEKLIAIYPYRDANNTKVTEETKNVTIIICGVPGIQKKTLETASAITKQLMIRFCDGQNSL